MGGNRKQGAIEYDVMRQHAETRREDAMILKALEQDFSVCKVEDYSDVNLEDDFCFIAKTDEERSLVCLTQNVPTNTITREDGWRAMRIEGELDFTLVGILAQLSNLLAEQRIGLFAISTYNTDYLLTKSADFDCALAALRAHGCEIDMSR